MVSPEMSVENIPQCLRNLPQWVVWRRAERAGKTTKVPYCAATGAPASITNPATWCSFDGALNVYQRDGAYDGIGFVLTDDAGFTGVDIDDCLDDGGSPRWGQDLVAWLGTYTEVSPSGRGVKLLLRGRKPQNARSAKRGLGPDGAGAVEIYDRARFFCITGRRLPEAPADIQERQEELDSLCNYFWPASPSRNAPAAASSPDRQFERCLASMLWMDMADRSDGSRRLYAAACRAVEHDLTDEQAVRAIREYERVKPFPKTWGDEEIRGRIRDAERECARGTVVPEEDEAVDLEPLLQKLGCGAGPTPSGNVATRVSALRHAPLSAGQLMMQYTELRPPVIFGLVRAGETMNIIAPSKAGKTWLITDLALALGTGRPWLDEFRTTPGRVLVLDNELHPETTADRLPRIAAARGIKAAEYEDAVYFEHLRGRLCDIFAMAAYFDDIEPGQYQAIILDALFRFLPIDFDENSNAAMAAVYNEIDRQANRLGCAFVLVHHTSKGNQAGKSVTDTGAGAGSQSRASDSHLVFRPHEEDGCVVLEAAVRSWPPVGPVCLRWHFPVWMPDPRLDPAALKSPLSRRSRARPASESVVDEPAWTTEQFVDTFVTSEPQIKAAILDAAGAAGLSRRMATDFLRAAEDERRVHRWTFGVTKPVKFATVAPPATDF
jgi:hypothetical protein